MSVNGHNVAKEVVSEETCPACERWLATIYDDGTFDLAEGVSLGMLAMLTGDIEGPLVPVTAKPDVGSARCMRWRCKLRRRLTGVPL